MATDIKLAVLVDMGEVTVEIVGVGFAGKILGKNKYYALSPLLK
jgi:hypothetical protein